VETDRTNAALLGFVILAVAALVLGMSSLALIVGLGAPWFAAVPLSLVLAALVACINRILVVRVVEPKRLRASIAAALAGTALALVVGCLMAGSFTLGAFRDAIDAERSAAISRQFDDRIAALQKQSESLRDRIDEDGRPQPERDRELTRLQTLLGAKYDELTKTEEAMREERAGRGGAAAGRGGGYWELKATLDRLSRERSEIAGRVEAERPKALERAEAEAAARTEPLKNELDVVVQQLDDLNEQRAKQSAAVDRDDRTAAAQVARCGTLFSLLTTAPVAPAFWLILVAYLMLQVSPVLLRLQCGSSAADDIAMRAARRGDRRPRTSPMPAETNGSAPPRQRVAADRS
jgi:hypothetical protein